MCSNEIETVLSKRPTFSFNQPCLPNNNNVPSTLNVVCFNVSYKAFINKEFCQLMKRTYFASDLEYRLKRVFIEPIAPDENY